MSRASPATKRLCADVNGPLFEYLANKVGAKHKNCVEMFREGAKLAVLLHIAHRMHVPAVASLQVQASTTRAAKVTLTTAAKVMRR